MGRLEPGGVYEDPDELGYTLSRSKAQDDLGHAFGPGEAEDGRTGLSWPSGGTYLLDIMPLRTQHGIRGAADRPAGSPQAEQLRNSVGYSWRIDPGGF